MLPKLVKLIKQCSSYLPAVQLQHHMHRDTVYNGLSVTGSLQCFGRQTQLDADFSFNLDDLINDTCGTVSHPLKLLKSRKMGVSLNHNCDVSK